MTTAYAERPYRKGVGIMLLNRSRHIFAGQRIDQIAEAWQMPQGGIDAGETPANAALRECAEEVGTGNVEIIAESMEWRPYDLPEAIADKVWNGQFRGQTQRWFAMRFLGTDTEIRVGEVAEPEFDAWRWLASDELMQLIVPFKQDLYRSVLAEFSDFLS